jgi:ABC-type dipeptide/oligopeptide/nickel transport system permease subunit
MDSEKRRGASQWAVAWRRFQRNRTGLIGLFIVLAYVFVGITSIWIAPYPPRSFDSLYTGEAGQPPSLKHPFGTTRAGLDVFSEVLHGARNDLFVGVFATVISTILGVSIGALSGYLRGELSNVLLIITQIFYSMPVLMLILMFARVFSLLIVRGFGLTLIALILGIFGWSGTAFVTRGEILKVREMDYITAARSLGASTSRILFKHVIPNVLTPIIVLATLSIAGNILTEVVISFLGFGDPNTSTWGIIIQESITYMKTEWWAPLFPGLATVLAVIGFNLLGDGLSDALNPRLREG